MWEPAVVVVATAHAGDVTPAVVGSISTRGGLAIVVGAPIAGAAWTLRPEGAMWTLEPLGLRLRPIGIDRAVLDDLDELVEDIGGPDLDDGRRWHRSATVTTVTRFTRSPVRQPSSFRSDRRRR